MLSIEDLPKDDSGLIPAGMWHVALRDNLTDGFAGMAFQDGVTTRPIDGRSVVKLTVNMGIVGALRVEGALCELGETVRIFAAHKTDAPAPVAARPVVAAPVPQEAPRALPTTPTSLAELDALTEAEARAMAAEMGSADKRWSVQKVRRYIADELGIED